MSNLTFCANTFRQQSGGVVSRGHILYDDIILREFLFQAGIEIFDPKIFHTCIDYHCFLFTAAAGKTA